MLRLALAASKRGAASAVVESVIPSSSSAAAAFTRSFAALPATTSEQASPFLRFASPAPAAHDFTPALQGLPETKVKMGALLLLRREKKKKVFLRRHHRGRRIAHRVFSFFRALFSFLISNGTRWRHIEHACLTRACLSKAL